MNRRAGYVVPGPLARTGVAGRSDALPTPSAGILSGFTLGRIIGDMEGPYQLLDDEAMLQAADEVEEAAAAAAGGAAGGGRRGSPAGPGGTSASSWGCRFAAAGWPPPGHRRARVGLAAYPGADGEIGLAVQDVPRREPARLPRRDPRRWDGAGQDRPVDCVDPHAPRNAAGVLLPRRTPAASLHTPACRALPRRRNPLFSLSSTRPLLSPHHSRAAPSPL